jgi:hypothetical protein
MASGRRPSASCSEARGNAGYLLLVLWADQLNDKERSGYTRVTSRCDVLRDDMDPQTNTRTMGDVY